MSRRVMKNIASLTLFCFLLTPLYGLFQVQAADGRFSGSDVIESHIGILTGMTAEVEGNISPRLMLLSDTGASEIAVTVSAHIGTSDSEAIIGYVLEFRNTETGDKYIVNGSSASNTAKLPAGTYVCYPIKVPDGMTYERLDDMKANITIDESHTDVSLVFAANNEAMDCYVATIIKGASGNYDTLLGNCSYTFSASDGNSSTELTTVDVGPDGIGYAKLNPNEYKVTLSNAPTCYVQSTSQPPISSIIDRKFVHIFYLDLREDIPTHNLTMDFYYNTDEGVREHKFSANNASMFIVTDDTYGINNTYIVGEDPVFSTTLPESNYSVKCVASSTMYTTNSELPEGFSNTKTYECNINLINDVSKDVETSSQSIAYGRSPCLHAASSVGGSSGYSFKHEFSLDFYDNGEIVDTPVIFRYLKNNSEVFCDGSYGVEGEMNCGERGVIFPVGTKYAKLLNTHSIDNIFSVDEAQAEAVDGKWIKKVRIDLVPVNSIPIKQASVKVVDNYDGTLVKDADVVLIDGDGNELPMTYDNTRQTYTKLVSPNKTYKAKLKTAGDGYEMNTDELTIGSDLVPSTVNFPVRYTDQREYPVSIVVKNQNNEVVDGAVLSITKVVTGDELAVPVEVTTQANGKFDLNLVEGEYKIEFVSLNGVPYATGAPFTFNHTYNAAEQTYNIVDEKRYEVRIEIIGPDNNPVEGMNVSLAGIDNKQATDASGLVIFNVPAGSYNYTVEDTENIYKPVICEHAIVCEGDLNPAKVTINLENKTLIPPAGDTMYPVHLKAVGAGSAPLEGATVKFISKSDSKEYTGTSDTNGSFDLSIPAGEYEVTLVNVSGNPNAYAPSMVYTNEENGMPVNFVISETRMFKLIFNVQKPDGSPAYGESLSLTGTVKETKPVERDGTVTFNIPAGTYGYSYTSDMGTYESQTNAAPIIVQEGYDLDPILIKLKVVQMRKLTLKVVDENENAIEGMQFKVFVEGSNYAEGTLTTDNTGAASINLQKGTYVVKHTGIVIGFNKIADETITLNDNDEMLRLVSNSTKVENKSSTVSIKVYDADNRPRSGVTLAFYRQTLARTVSGIPDYTAETDIDGVASVVVEEGDYNVYITSAPMGFEYDGEPYKTFSVTGGETKDVGIIKEGYHAGDNPTVPDPEDPPVVDENNKGTIRVSVMYNGAPMSGVGFSIMDEEGNITRHTSDSAFMNIDKTVGTYEITVTSVPGGYTISGSSSTTIVVNKDNTTAVQLNVTRLTTEPDPSNPSSNTKGNLLINAIFNGSNVSGIGFSVHDADGNFISQGTTDTSGLLRFTNLNPGQYTLYNVTVTDGYDLMNSRRVSVTPNQTTEVKVALSLKDNHQVTIDPNANYGVLNVTSKDADGNPIADAEFTLFSYEEEVDTAVSGSDGVATFYNITPGVYYYVWTGIGNSNSRTLERKSITISKGEVASVGVTAPKERSREISGVVFEDVNGNGIYESKYDSLYKGAKVQLLDEEGEKLLEVKTDEDGEYRFKYVPNGDYTLKLVKVRGYNYIDKRYGTYTDSSSIDKRGEVDIYIEDEDEDDIMMGIISEDLVINPILGNGAANNVNKQDGRFPTLGATSDIGLHDSGNPASDDIFQISYENKDGLYTIDSPAPSVNNSNSNLNTLSGSEDKVSNLPKTGSIEFIEVAVLYMLFMFVVMYTFRRFIFDKFVD